MDKDGIQVEGGWSIDANLFVDGLCSFKESFLENTLVFSAVNHINGQTISMTYEDAAVGFALLHGSLTRKSGQWIQDENTIYKTLLKGNEIEKFYMVLSNYLNPGRKNLLPLKISSWTVIHNNLSDILPISNELLFSAVRGKFFIDVSFQKNIGTYAIFMGIAKSAYNHIDYNLSKPVIECIELNLKDMDKLKDLINNVLVKREDFFYQILRLG